MELFITLIVLAVLFVILSLILYLRLREVNSRRRYSEDKADMYKRWNDDKDDLNLTLKQNLEYERDKWDRLVGGLYYPDRDWFVDFRIVNDDNCPVEVKRLVKIGKIDTTHDCDSVTVISVVINGDKDTFDKRRLTAQMICDMLNEDHSKS